MKVMAKGPRDEWAFCLFPCIAFGKYYDSYRLKYTNYIQLGWLLWNIIFDFE